MPRCRSLLRSLVAPVVALLASAGCATQDSAQPPQEAQLLRAVSPPDRLEPPAYLPGEARALLRARMASHARDMSALMSAVMILRYPEIGKLAQGIVHEDRFAEARGADATELNSALPPAFFVHDRQLRVSAAALAAAAERMDARGVAASYGRVSETCVSCHATYRTGQ